MEMPWPRREAELQSTKGKPEPLFLRRRPSLHPGEPCPQVRAPEKHHQSTRTRSQCKHTLCRGTGCPVDYYFEIDGVWGFI